ncbi:MAG TPA: plasmid pRiA4b ORF-3 family protein [Myxococcales bacterium]|nr:plasmid pRiA4b ORF-3 family protein [Myxococcales bacterium]
MARKAKVVPLRARKPPRSPGAYLLKVTLEEVRPAIWRRIRVAGDLTLRELHHVLQIALGWTDSHLHEFEIDGKRYGMPDPLEDIGEPPDDEQDYRLDELLRKGSHAEYLYDFGDGWRHEIVVEGEEPANRGATKAECLAGARACPPEDSGGAYGYDELLKALVEPTNRRHRELLEWVGPHFAPEELDLLSINRALRGAGSVRWRQRRERFYSL